MEQTLCILGRQPAIGLAELESLYGGDTVRPAGNGEAATLSLVPSSVDFSRLGGTVKFCEVLTILDTQDWKGIQDFLKQAIPQHLTSLPEGKMRLGLSTYGLRISPKQINVSGLQLKKIIKATGRSVRVIPNVELALNSAQVLHNQLTGPLGWELVFVADKGRTIVAQNIAEQDITAYARRDQNRPKRDARVGMLPPKLAQTIINLAVGKTDLSDPSCGPAEDKGISVLDPFCGTGVILQESLLMGYHAYGTDLEPRMIDYAKTNLKWLQDTHKVTTPYALEGGDATNFKWDPDQLDTIATETYLGRPFATMPSFATLEEVIRDVDTIHQKFLKNLAKQTKIGFRACVAVPCWVVNNRFKHLPSLDHLEKLGYTRVSFAHASNEEMIYHRPDQIVGRELIVIVRK